ncbi:hypothetical protein J6590_023923 [Homalodisca vitripennis]|nr:hypothetical protein J6590_023923 [Homalodisca vitripennis]
MTGGCGDDVIIYFARSRDSCIKAFMSVYDPPRRKLNGNRNICYFDDSEITPMLVTDGHMWHSLLTIRLTTDLAVVPTSALPAVSVSITCSRRTHVALSADH